MRTLVFACVFVVATAPAARGQHIFSGDFEPGSPEEWSSATTEVTICSGIALGGGCWWFGENDESCVTVCSTHGGFNDSTLSYAGSAGSNANCSSVITAIGQGTPSPVTSVASLGGISGMGCGADWSIDSTAYRLTSATTSTASSASKLRRRAVAARGSVDPSDYRRSFRHADRQQRQRSLCRERHQRRRYQPAERVRVGLHRGAGRAVVSG